MRKFIRKNYQEIIAVFLVLGFWGGVYAYHSYQASRQAFEEANTLLDSPALEEPTSPAPSPLPAN